MKMLSAGYFNRIWIMGFLALFLSLAPMQTVWAETAGIQIKRISTGVVVPNRSVTLSAKISARVVAITRDEGEFVKGEAPACTR